MNSADRLKLRRRFGVPSGSSQCLHVNFKQLSRDGLTISQVRKALANLHPKLMKNLYIRRDGSLVVLDENLRWLRRCGWTADYRYCRFCERFLEDWLFGGRANICRAHKSRGCK